ncbi:MAG: hypothetical protein ACQGVK_00135 [Myxococcota bacterium]
MPGPEADAVARADAEGREIRGLSWILLGLALVANAAFLHWLWRHWSYWGIWDWDFQASLIEVARRSIVDYGQLPMWNPWLGGGGSLVGHPLASTYCPSLLPALFFGTVAGFKLCIWIYLAVAQIGTYRLARRLDLDPAPAVLAALVFSWGGVFAQHLAHGHIGWIGYAWVPFVIGAVHACSHRLRVASLAAGSIFLALCWLDGSVYNYVVVPIFLGLYAGLVSLQQRSVRPLVAVSIIGVLAAGVAAIEIVPVAEMVFEHPRRAGPANNYYGAAVQPGALELLYRAFLSRQQAHDAEAWMPLVVNVGAYVGVLPLVLAALALALRPRAVWPWAACCVAMLLICLGEATPVDPWRWLRRLPGLDSMQIPMRWRIVPLLCLAMLAGFGLQAAAERLRPWAGRRPVLRFAPAAVAAVVALDLFAVNAPVFETAYVVPAIETTPGEFHHLARSPYRSVYRETAIRPIWDNWPTASFATIRENRGVLLEFWPMVWPRLAVPADRSDYPGAELAPLRPDTEVTRFEITPNRLSASTRGAGGTIVINQNYQPGWRVVEGDGARITSQGGLLAVRVEAGEQTFQLAYRPPTFLLAAALSLGSLALLGLGVVAARRWPGGGAGAA